MEEGKKSRNGKFSAAASAVGYLYQCRFGLLQSLDRLKKSFEFKISFELLDDVEFEEEGKPIELLQTKHHLNSAANLTDASPDLWNTLRVWSEGKRNGDIPEDALLFLITTAVAPQGSAAFYLKPDTASRNVEAAEQHLVATAQSSTNQSLQKAITAFKALTDEQRKALIESITVLDASPSIQELDELLREAVFGFAPREHSASFLQRLEGWWYQQAVRQLAAPQRQPILGEELEDETSRLREQFKEDSLPIDDDILEAIIDENAYQDRVFVEQLRLILVNQPRIVHAIRNYYRAFEHRSRWTREELLLVGDLERYEKKLLEEWDLRFAQMKDDLGEEATEQMKVKAAEALYRWIETGAHARIRQNVTEPSIARGTYQILSDRGKVGWHHDFAERLKHLLSDRRAA